MNIKKTIDAVDVVDYVNSCSKKPFMYFLIYDTNTKKFERIQVKDIYVDLKEWSISIRSDNVINLEKTDIPVELSYAISPIYNKNIWTQVSKSDCNNPEFKLLMERFDGMISMTTFNNTTIYFVNISKIPSYSGIINIRYSNNNDNFENVAFRFLHQYANKIREEMNALDAELSMKKDEYERELEDMRNEHQLNIDLLNLEHDNEISDLQAEHEDEISGLQAEYEIEISDLQAEHEKCVREIKRNHEKELKVLKKLLNFVINDE